MLGQLRARSIPVVGPAEAVTGPPPPRARYRDQPQTGWQLAQRVWADSGVSWEPVAPPRSGLADPYAPENDPYAAAAYGSDWYQPGRADDSFGVWPVQPQPTRADLPVIESPPPRLEPAEYDSVEFAPGRPDPDRAGMPVPPASAARPLSAPVSYADLPVSNADPSASYVSFADPSSSYVSYADPPVSRVTYADLSGSYADAPARIEDAPSRIETDELFRAWQGSVRQAAGPRAPWSRGRAGRDAGRRGRQAVKVGVPALVLVTVGAGALLMLTGRANNMMVERSGSTAAASVSPAFSAGLSPVPGLAGYPGQHGLVAVAAMWSAGGLTLASGTADGHPALWRHSSGGSWTLVSAAALGPVTGHLTSVTHGPLGWVAVGSAVVDGRVQPVLYQSADGLTWTGQGALTALAGDGAQFLGVTASSGGYVVAGKTVRGKGSYATLWWSADLKSWTASGGSGSPGSFAAAVVSVGDGFAAVGSEMNCHTIWTSPDGRRWTAHDLAKPGGATSATLRSVAAGPGGRLVAAGYGVTSGGNIPIVVSAASDGTHLTQLVLSSPGGPTVVTAVTTTASGFVAVGVAGSGTAARAVTWTSRDGLTWSPATTLSGAGSGQVTALASTGPSSAGPVVTGTLQTGPATTLLSIPAS